MRGRKAIEASGLAPGNCHHRACCEGKGATVTARFNTDGITICDPNSPQIFQRIYRAGDLTALRDAPAAALS